MQRKQAISRDGSSQHASILLSSSVEVENLDADGNAFDPEKAKGTANSVSRGPPAMVVFVVEKRRETKQNSSHRFPRLIQHPLPTTVTIPVNGLHEFCTKYTVATLT